jgi:hypothetical protein
MITIDDLTKVYGSRTVIERVNLTVSHDRKATGMTLPGQTNLDIRKRETAGIPDRAGSAVHRQYTPFSIVSTASILRTGIWPCLKTPEMPGISRSTAVILFQSLTSPCIQSII